MTDVSKGGKCMGRVISLYIINSDIHVSEGRERERMSSYLILHKSEMKILFVQTQCKQIIGLKIKKYFISFKSAYISLI